MDMETAVHKHKQKNVCLTETRGFGENFKWTPMNRKKNVVVSYFVNLCLLLDSSRSVQQITSQTASLELSQKRASCIG